MKLKIKYDNQLISLPLTNKTSLVMIELLEHIRKELNIEPQYTLKLFTQKGIEIAVDKIYTKNDFKHLTKEELVLIRLKKREECPQKNTKKPTITKLLAEVTGAKEELKEQVSTRANESIFYFPFGNMNLMPFLFQQYQGGIGNIGINNFIQVNNGNQNNLYQDNIQRLIEMGFPQSRAHIAMRLANNNLNAASQILLNSPEFIFDQLNELEEGHRPNQDRDQDRNNNNVGNDNPNNNLNNNERFEVIFFGSDHESQSESHLSDNDYD